VRVLAHVIVSSVVDFQVELIRDGVVFPRLGEVPLLPGTQPDFLTGGGGAGEMALDGRAERFIQIEGPLAISFMGVDLPSPWPGSTCRHGAIRFGLAGFGETIVEKLNDFVAARQETFDLRIDQVGL
jgi:hypothetical protein